MYLTRIYVHKYTNIYTYIHIDIYIYMCTHTYIYTYTLIMAKCRVDSKKTLESESVKRK